jgi:P4 family phage/plasmid primase-like protien
MTQDELIERVKEAATVYVAAEVCGVRLPRPGVKCKVPWRADKNPSATVLPDGRRIHDFSAGDGMDAVGMVQEMKGVGFPMALNLLAEEMGLTLPFEEEYGRGRSRVLVEALGRWPGAVIEVEAVPVVEEVRGGIANFAGGMKDEAAHETITAACRALAEDETDQEAVAEWRGFSVSFVRALAVEGRLGAVRDEAGALCVLLPCAKAAGLWVRAQLRKVGPRAAGCEWFWPAKSEHKPGPWVAAEGLAGGLLIVGEGWGDAAAGRLLADEPEARIVATLGTGVRKLEGVNAGAVVLLRQNEAGDANARWSRGVRALFPTVPFKSALPPAGLKDWNDVLKRHGQKVGEGLLTDARGVADDPTMEGMTPEQARRGATLFNDTMAAEMLAEVCEGKLKHDAVTGWHELQEEGHWEPVPPKRALWWAAKMAEAARAEADEVRKKLGRGGKDGKKEDMVTALLNFARACGCTRSQKAALEMALARDDLSASFRPWEIDKMLLPVRGGMLDLRREAKGLWRPLRPDDLVTWRAGCAFDEAVGCPRWSAFVSSICQGDKEMVAFLQRWAGYVLTGDVSEQQLLFLFGMGSNGKSTFLKTLQAVLGDFARVVPLSMVTLDRMGNAAPDVEMLRLKGARLAVPPELERGAKLAEAVVKTLTGGDRLRGRGHYQSSEEFMPTHKLAFFSNSKPGIRGGDEGIWRRMNLMHLRKAFKGAEKIAKLDELLLKELPGILNWCIVGCWEWQRMGLNPPQSVLDEVNEYRETSDVLGMFLDEHVERVPVRVVTLAELRKKIKAWAEAEGENWLASISTRKLRKEMEERGWEVRTDRNKMGFVMANWLDADGELGPWEDGQ